MDDQRFFDWLAGFIDGEGSFVIEKWKPGRLKPRFYLQIRDDDEKILLEIVRRTGLGTVRYRPSRGNRNPSAVWVVTSLDECLALRDLLVDHPLRAKKERDFWIWSEALFARIRGDHAALQNLRDEMTKTRTYPQKTYEPHSVNTPPDTSVLPTALDSGPCPVEVLSSGQAVPNRQG